MFLVLLLVFLYLFKKRKKEKRKPLFNNLIDTDLTIANKKEVIIKNEIVTKIIKGLKKLEEEQYFLKTECSAYNTAKKIKTNTSYLSKTIKSHYKKTFNDYINNLRINYVMNKLESDRRFRSFSIQSITEELGYKSTDSFTKYFKLHTGMLPSTYIKKLNMQLKAN